MHSFIQIYDYILAAVASVGGALFVLQQFAGINGVLYFSSLTFKDVGITNGALASLLVGITNFAGYKGMSLVLLFCFLMWTANLIQVECVSFTGALIALYLMDRQGRKKLLIGSYLGMVSGICS